MRVVDIDVTLPPSSELEVETLAISDITYNSFEASLNYDADYEENSTNTLSYCNRSAQPACDPVSDGMSVAMDRGASSFTATVSGLTPNADYAVRYVGVDPDGVIGSDIQNVVISLLDEPLTISNLSITNTTKTGMTVEVDFSGDLLDNGSATLYYCNETLNSSCDPEDLSGGVNGPLVMTKGASSFVGTLSGLAAPDFNEADRVKVRVVADDVDGTVDSPINSAAYLADLTLDIKSDYLINTTRDSFEVEVQYTEDNTNGSVDLYFCNETNNPSCDPVIDGQSAPMSRLAGDFYVNLTGVTVGFSHGDMIKIRIVGTDADGVRYIDNPMERSFRLTGISVQDLNVSRIVQDQFYISLDYSGDGDGDSVTQAYYCNKTNNASCDPLTNTPKTLSKSSGLIQGYLTSLLSSNDPGDVLNLRVEVTDPDGVYADGVVGSPGVFQIDVLIPNPIDIYRSVGVGEELELSSAIIAGATLTIDSASTVSFTQSLSNAVGVGDALIFDSNGSSSSNAPDTVVFINSRINNSTFSVQTFNGGDAPVVTGDEDWKIFRSYTSLHAAVEGIENEGIPASLRDFDIWSGGYDISAQTGSDLNWNIALYDSGVVDDTPVVISSPWKTDWGNMVRVFTPHNMVSSGSLQRHQGAWNSNLYTFETSSSESFRVSGVSSVVIEGLQIHHVGTEDSATTVRFNNAEKFIFMNNLVRSSSIGLALRGFRATRGHKGANVNNVYFGFTTVGSYAVDNVWEWNESRKAHYNNTFYDVYHAMRYTSSHNYLSSSAKNNLALNCVDACYVGFGSRSINPRNNASGDDSADSISNDSGTSISNVGDASLHLEDPIGLDFRLRASSSLIDAGVDLSNDPNNIYDFTQDFLGNTRPAGMWSVGASQ